MCYCHYIWYKVENEIINLQYMCEDYTSRSVCVSATEVASIYLVYILKVGCH